MNERSNIMGYGPRTWGIIDNKGKFSRWTYA